MGILVILVFLSNVAMMVWVALAALKIKNGPVAAFAGRVTPMAAKGKAIAETAKRALEENKERLQTLTAEVKGIAETVRPGADGVGPQLQIDYRSLMTVYSTLRTVRGGWKQIQRMRHPVKTARGSAPPKKKSTLARIRTVASIVRILLNVRKAVLQKAAARA